MDDPLQEKMLIESYGLGQWIEYLRKKAGTGAMYIAPEEDTARASEVYRRSYVQAGPDRVDIVGDFVAHFPDLVCSSGWLAELLRPYKLVSFRDFRSNKNRLLQALASGFRRAANPQYKRTLRVTSLLAAQNVRQDLQSEIRKFLKDSPISEVEEGWFRKQVETKVQDFVRRFPRLSPISNKIKDHLLRRQAYGASLVMVAKIFNVRQRRLESKLP